MILILFDGRVEEDPLVRFRHFHSKRGRGGGAADVVDKGRDLDLIRAIAGQHILGAAVIVLGDLALRTRLHVAVRLPAGRAPGDQVLVSAFTRAPAQPVGLQQRRRFVGIDLNGPGIILGLQRIDEPDLLPRIRLVQARKQGILRGLLFGLVGIPKPGNEERAALIVIEVLQAQFRHIRFQGLLGGGILAPADLKRIDIAGVKVHLVIVIAARDAVIDLRVCDAQNRGSLIRRGRGEQPGAEQRQGQPEAQELQVAFRHRSSFLSSYAILQGISGIVSMLNAQMPCANLRVKRAVPWGPDRCQS